MKRTARSLVAIGLAAFASLGLCGESHTASCYSSGSGASEPLGDRDGHSVQATSLTCLESGGVFEGLVSTQNVIWEHDHSGSKLLSGDGMGRKPGALVVLRYLEGRREPILHQGKRVGWLAKGRGIFTLATGDMAKLSGKAFSWVVTGGGPHRINVETTLDD